MNSFNEFVGAKIPNHLLRLYKIPDFIQFCFSQLIWRIPNSEKKVFLTFDDGPHPQSTPYILEMLEQFEARATFFCLGAHIELYPEMFNRILNAGHGIGNHGYHHLSGWQTRIETYIKNTRQGSKITGSDLFRPPYGRLTWQQYNNLKCEFKILMWSLNTYDYDQKQSLNTTINKLCNHTKSGSIVLFHDQPSSLKTTLYILYEYLSHLTEKGFSCESIEEAGLSPKYHL
ncbi:MAG TPA: polysaccharide deacetylase family protein [Saprospiraceae bacterium]|nr:polysaccharide deacetylase family protein [Saprospiraceae bacterium]